MLRNLIFLGMLVGAASMAGWLTIDRQGDQTTIQFNRNEFRNDARAAIDRGREYLDQREAQRAAERDHHQYQGDFSGGFHDRQYEARNYPDQRYPRDHYQPAPQYDSAPYQPPAQPGANYYPASHTYRP